VEPKSSLVRSDSTIELNSKTTVDVFLTVIINPRNSEMNETLRFNNSLDDVDVLWMTLPRQDLGFQELPILLGGIQVVRDLGRQLHHRFL
jgi:hypothetical protein